MNSILLGWRRPLKRAMAAVLPEGVKKHLRAPLYGYRRARVALPVSFEADRGASRITIDGRVALRFAEEHRAVFRTHFVDHGAAVEEMASFIGLAAGARVLFDIGADRAIFSHVFCAMDAPNRAVAYEPSPDRMRSAKSLAAMNGFGDRILYRDCALQRQPGRATASVFADRTVVVGASPDGLGTIDVDISSVDREVAQLGLVPDLLKIDVEGDEYDVLLGAQRLLGERKPAICLELHLDLLERRGTPARLVVALLESHGYRFRTCRGDALRPREVSDSVHAILRLVAV